MKKSIKNTIMIGMATVLIGTSAVTYAYASDTHRQPRDNMQMNQQMPGFDKQNGFDGNQGMNGRQGAQNGMPDNKQGDRNQQPPAQDNNSQQQVPQGDNNTQTPPQQNGNSSQNSPSLPNNENNSNSEQNADSATGQKSTTDTNAATSVSDSEFEALAANLENGNMRRDKGNKLQFFALYTFLAIQLAIILLIVIYLILSKFNTLSFNQVFPEKKEEKPEA